MTVTDYVERSDQSEDGEGIWMLCTRCEGCWRPKMQEAHEEGCPVAEVRRLRAALRHIADGNLSPCVRFAQYVLDGYGVEDAHRQHVSYNRLPSSPEAKDTKDTKDTKDKAPPGMPVEEMLRCARQLMKTGRHNPQFDTYSPGQHTAAREFDEALPRMMEYLLSAELRPRRVEATNFKLQDGDRELLLMAIRYAIAWVEERSGESAEEIDPLSELDTRLRKSEVKCNNCGRPATYRYWDKLAWAYFCSGCASKTDEPMAAPSPNGEPT